MTDLDVIVLFAIRYALPRNTSAPYSLIAFLSRHVDELSGPGRRRMVEEIERECRPVPSSECGADWTAILRLLREAGGEVAV